jgi:1,4-dihydroxy-2-naphthoyl-CoA synthase
LNWIDKEHAFNIKRGLALPTPQKVSAVFFTGKKDGCCLFCHGSDRGGKGLYQPEKGIEFICSACVQTLLNADQDYLKRILALAEGQNYEQRKPKPKFRIHTNRKRATKTCSE